jgi:hypothetical protein
MDVESAIKINELAKELAKKGFASSSEDASKMAEQFLTKNGIPARSLSQPKGNDKFEILMERVQRKFDNDISAVHEKINSVVNKLNVICDEISRLKAGEIQDNKNLPSQRTGEYKPGDIDINKVFYYGNK